MHNFDVRDSRVFQDTVEVMSLVSQERVLSQIHYRNLDVHDSRVEVNVAASEMFPHEKFDEVCQILDLKLAELREAEKMVERLARHAAITGQACDADAASEGRLTCESFGVFVESCQQDPRALLFPSPSGEDKRSLIDYTKLAVGPEPAQEKSKDEEKVCCWRETDLLALHGARVAVAKYWYEVLTFHRH